MRKFDWLLVVLMVSALAGWLHPRWQGGSAPTGSPSPASSPRLTNSGRWEVLAPPLKIAGISIGATQREVLAALGHPRSEASQENLGLTWTYASDGAELQIHLLEGRVTAISSQGRWSLTQNDGKSLPGFMHPRSQVQGAWGEPQRKDLGEQVWCYQLHPGELTYHFDHDSVTQVHLVGEIKPVSAPPSPR